MGFSMNVGAPEAPAEPAATPAPREGKSDARPALSADDLALVDTGDGPGSDTSSTGEIEHRPGENRSEAIARAQGFLLDENDGDGGGVFAVDESAEEDADALVESEPEAERFPWQRPADLSEDELAEWKEQQGLPQTAEDYALELPEGQTISEAGRPIVDSFLAFAVEHDLPEATVSKAISWYNEQGIARQAALKDGDKHSKEAATEALQERWEDQFNDNLSVATAGLESLPESLQKALRAARGPDGRKLLHDPDFAQLLFDLGARAQDGDNDQSAGSEAKAIARQQAGLHKELADIQALLRKDVDAYRSRPWKGTGKTAGERAVEIRRLLQNPKSPSGTKAALGAEREELERLRDTDPEVFDVGRWRNSKQTPAQRLDDILSGLA